MQNLFAVLPSILILCKSKDHSSISWEPKPAKSSSFLRINRGKSCFYIFNTFFLSMFDNITVSRKTKPFYRHFTPSISRRFSSVFDFFNNFDNSINYAIKRFPRAKMPREIFLSRDSGTDYHITIGVGGIGVAGDKREQILTRADVQALHLVGIHHLDF